MAFKIIDKTSIYTIIKLDENRLKNNNYTKVYYNQLHIGYKQKINDIIIYYDIHRHKLKLIGRLANMISISDLTTNFDELWRGDVQTQQDIDTMIDNTNRLLYQLFDQKLNILDFKVSRIELCCNVPCASQLDVSRYIFLFNKTFDMFHGQADRFINHALNKRLRYHTSYYIKTKKTYQNQDNNYYAINFYNKYEQLRYLNRRYKSKSNVKDSDIRASLNILRLEIKLHSRKLPQILKQYKINNLLRDFNFFVCRNILIDFYTKFICTGLNPYVKFVSYETAKKIIEVNCPDPKLMEYIKYISQTNKITNNKYSQATNRKYIKQLFAIGIHFCFVPKSWNIDILTSPITLLDEKIKENQKQRYTYQNQIIDTDNKLQYINFGIGKNNDISKLFNSNKK